MGGVLAVLAVYLIVGLWEIVPLARRRKRKKITVYIVMWAAALAVSLMLVRNVKIPSFEEFMIRTYNAIAGRGGGQ